MKTAGGCGVVPFWSVERIFSFFTIAAYQNECADIRPCQTVNRGAGNDSNLLIVFYVQIMPDDFVMQLHR
ncbi:hypothetical protein RNO31_22785, partial [Escherichia coli]|nr:hypothetical protein [Escherichia coli]